MSYKNVRLDDPMLGQKLVADPISLPLDVFEIYVAKNTKEDSDLPESWTCPDWQSIELLSPISPKDAIAEAATLAAEISVCLHKRPRPAVKKAVQVVALLNDILFRASPGYRRGRGQPARKRPDAVRAWVIKKYNPRLTFPEITDLVLVRKGKCEQTISEGKSRRRAQTCKATKHGGDSQCVDALRKELSRLIREMERCGIPTS
jgi:hypothetical protein